jgi:hypothetical protein
MSAGFIVGFDLERFLADPADAPSYGKRSTRGRDTTARSINDDQLQFDCQLGGSDEANNEECMDKDDNDSFIQRLYSNPSSCDGRAMVQDDHFWQTLSSRWKVLLLGGAATHQTSNSRLSSCLLHQSWTNSDDSMLDPASMTLGVIPYTVTIADDASREKSYGLSSLGDEDSSDSERSGSTEEESVEEGERQCEDDTRDDEPYSDDQEPMIQPAFPPRRLISAVDRSGARGCGR